MNRLMRLADALIVLELVDGYRPAATTGDARLDAREAARMRCDACDRDGLRYMTLRRHGSPHHRGLAWCRGCLETIEL
jgi:hypothetical protein